jgi:hypothetical protein
MRRTHVLAAGLAAVLLGGAATASAHPTWIDRDDYRYHQRRDHHYDGYYPDRHWRNRPWWMGRREDWQASQRYPWRGRHDWDGWDD